MELEYLTQQLITGLSNGMIIALIALGYTMVYGIIELINFAHGDLFMLGSFMALTVVGMLGLDPQTANSFFSVALLLIIVAPFCAGTNWLVDRLAYRHLRNAPRLAPLVSREDAPDSAHDSVPHSVFQIKEPKQRNLHAGILLIDEKVESSASPIKA